MNPSFVVPAEYFYVLGASLPPEVTPEQRYQIACLEQERQSLDKLKKAIESGVISPSPTPQQSSGPAVTPEQAARRLRALGAVKGASQVCKIGASGPVHDLVSSWLEYKNPTPKDDPQLDIAPFWSGVPSVPAQSAGHLELVLCLITQDHAALIQAIRNGFSPSSVEDLAGKTEEEWRGIFPDEVSDAELLLPPFTRPGTVEERIGAFIRHLRKFFDVTAEGPPWEEPTADGPPNLGLPLSDPLSAFIASSGLTFGQVWDEAAFHQAFDAFFNSGAYPFDRSDTRARVWLERALRTINDLYVIAGVLGADQEALRFSLMEALYARGFTTKQSIQALTLNDFQRALTGTVAFDHAAAIHAKAGSQTQSDGACETTFRPINADGLLTNCVPPPHRSPLGPVAYLHELLRLCEASTCDEPLPESCEKRLEAALAARRGPLGELHGTRANLETPLPLIDLVNECLEAVAADATSAHGVAYDTAADKLGGHLLRAPGAPEEDGDNGPFRHDPAALFAAMPERSSPATPVKKAIAYDKLKGDFSAPVLPYAQPLDISRSYLRQLRTSRYAVMRRFRKNITEFVLDPAPAQEPDGFQRHLWRYPVRIEIAREYLGITPEEYAHLFTTDITGARLRELYGFGQDAAQTWMMTVLKLSEFLERTGLSYCELIELWKSEFVQFRHKAAGTEEGGDFPACEPCYLGKHTIELVEPENPKEALCRLAVFIRLWRKLQHVDGAKYTFSQLRDICEVLPLFGLDGAINPDFIRQLAAFQMLRDHFALDLADASDDAPGTGADRTHLLALWVGEGARMWSWAVDHLLDQLRHYAQARYKCGCRPPEFIKLLAENLDALARLAGFDPSQQNPWHARPTHTLRFAEVLSKIYAADFGIGEILFLFTADAHLAGGDPFALQPENEALESPLDLPDDDHVHSLWALRSKLLAVEVSDEEVSSWTWPRIDASLRGELGFEPPQGTPDPLHSLGEHFFPGVLESSGWQVAPLARQYRVALDPTSAPMWNTPAEGPFRYDPIGKQLWTQVPMTDEAVLAKLGRIRQLSTGEQHAVRDLYFLPRLDLARFVFLFESFAEADRRLVQEPDEAARWAYFQRQFALCHARCRIIAQHLAEHVAEATGSSSGEGFGLAWRLLKHLLADENKATAPWESDGGKRPDVTWGPQPSGGAFAALLGLTGTGLRGELGPESGGDPLWVELRGPMDAFGSTRNAWNAPIPTVLPSMNFTITHDQMRLVGARNGFALANVDGARLGGAQGFSARWRGLLLVEAPGPHGFWAGAPTPDGEEPDAEAAKCHRWRVTLKRGQKTWVLLSHRWPGEEAPAACAAPLHLKRGVYELTVELVQPQSDFDGPEDVCPQTTGFQLKYAGPDTGDQIIAVPLNRLFLDRKDATLGSQADDTVAGQARQLLEILFTSTMRDIRRTYQRAFKSLLFAHRFGLSAKPMADSGQSEIGYVLEHAEDFAGSSYYFDRYSGKYKTHRAWFDFNLLPLRDSYLSPVPEQDQRVAPSVERQQALFDGWERAFDYTALRREAETAPERPVWLVFHEAAENHPDDPAHLLRHMGVDLSHAGRVMRYYSKYDVSSADLEDERWAVRVWQAERWIRSVITGFLCKDIRDARPELWASNNPGLNEAGELQSGNANLTRFVREGCIETGEPRRYEEIQRLNDGLRERARQALLAYLCRMDRVSLPWGGAARAPKDLSELLLLDVEVGVCQRASRIEEAITSVQLFVQRSRLGLEPGWTASPAFMLLWDRRFATFSTWEACKRRELYRENWVEWSDLEAARRTEAFRLLESELRRATLTVPVPGGMQYWSGPRPPTHPGLTVLQAREPATMQRLDKAPEGFDLLGTPERHARPSWLAAVHGSPQGQGENIENIPGGQLPANGKLPFWIEAAIRLGARFVRVAAAGLPSASAAFAPASRAGSAGCCVDCGQPHAPVVDEYYFWLIDTRYFDKVEQHADVKWEKKDKEGGEKKVSDHEEPEEPEESKVNVDGWHEEMAIPKLLHWKSKPMVHLMWCRIHNGVLQQPRRSHEGVRIDDGKEGKQAQPQLTFAGRQGDSLRFEVSGGAAPDGYEEEPAPGFRYDLATDSAVVLPLVAKAPAPTNPLADLTAYPYFAYAAPGAPLMPPSLFSPALAVAGALRAHCRFEAALKWYEGVFNPLQGDAAWCSQGAGEGSKTTPAADAGCCKHSGVVDSVARRRAITLHYLETLLEWGDAMMRRNSPEAFQQARLIFDTAARILGERPLTVLDGDTATAPPTVAGFVPHVAPLNPRLMMLYELADDRLSLIHACLQVRRLRNGPPNKDMSYWGNSPLRNGWQTAAQVCLDEGDGCSPHSPYRFVFLAQKSQELANEVRGLGAALLAAFEKGDAEYLASLRVDHERQLLTLALAIRQDQWREADWQVQALQKAKEIAQTRRRYYATLIKNGLNGGEMEYEALTGTSIDLRNEGIVFETIGQMTNMIPDLYIGFPVILTHLPIGTKLAGLFFAIARIMNTQADIANTTASLRLTQGGWARREDEWHHQVEVLDIEIDQIERQILAAERRRDIALRELNSHQRQIEHAAEVHDFLRDKFTSHELYLWLQKETAALHHQMYELALHTARQAERAFNYERGHTAVRFVPADAWDNLREGLLAGERLALSLRRMEKAYLDANAREYELTKHISLRLHFPLQFLQLKMTGACEIEIPEWMFDLDYPGHYMRRIKNVTLTVPCVAGPYTGVHCRLTLLSAATRVDPRLSGPAASCCEGANAKSAKPVRNGYAVLPEDPRIVKQYAATEAIATSSGQNDAGMFELSFRDERYLPFEFAGAVSRWRIELPQENNAFDMDTLSDLVVHLNYTAREGGDVLRRAANEVAQQRLPDAGLRVFDVRHELPDAWYRFQGQSPEGGSAGSARLLDLRMGRDMFAYVPGKRDVRITRLELFFEAPGAEPSAHHVVELLVGPMTGHKNADRCKCDVHRIQCMASAAWPGLYHGVLEVPLGPLSQSAEDMLGSLSFPAEAGAVSRVFLLCAYSTR
ncbi:neuraminidase-like domain-containing protein [Sorangium sp. So ce134]